MTLTKNSLKLLELLGYDAKSNPWLPAGNALGKQLFFPMPTPPDASMISRNNYGSKTDGQTTNVRNLEYASNGYPVRITDIQTAGNTVTTSVFTYSYSCQK